MGKAHNNGAIIKGEVTRAAILEFIQAAGRPVGTAEIKALGGYKTSTVCTHIKRLIEAGEIRPVGSGRMIRYEVGLAEPDMVEQGRIIMPVYSVPHELIACLIAMCELDGEVSGPWSLARAMNVSHDAAARLIERLRESRLLKRIAGTDAYAMTARALAMVSPGVR